MTFKSAMSTVGNGLLECATVVHNANLQPKIDTINVEIAELQRQMDLKLAEKAALTGQLIRN